jgi:hypothetical protein
MACACECLSCKRRFIVGLLTRLVNLGVAGHCCVICTDVGLFVCCTRSNDVLVEELFVAPPDSKPLHFDRPYAASVWEQFRVLWNRWFISYW